MCPVSSFLDFVFVFFGGYLVSYFFNSGLLLTCILFSFPIMINKFNNPLHYIFGVNTRFFNSIGIKFDEKLD